MKIRRIKSRLKTRLYPIIWSGIIVVSVYIILRYAALSFLNNSGQADKSFQDVIFSNVCGKVMESGSSVIGYVANEGEETVIFPISLITDGFALKRYVKNDSVLTATAQDYASLLQGKVLKQSNNGKSLTQDKDDLLSNENNQKDTNSSEKLEELLSQKNLNQVLSEENDQSLDDKLELDQQMSVQLDIDQTMNEQSESDINNITQPPTGQNKADQGDFAQQEERPDNMEEQSDPMDEQAVQTDSNKVQDVNDQSEWIDVYDIEEGHLSLEYILTNGALYSSKFGELTGEASVNKELNSELQIGYLEGDVFIQETEDDSNPDKDKEAAEVINPGASVEYTMEQLKDISFLVRNFYIVDKSTKVTDKVFDAEKLLGKDMTIKQKNDAPQILIYHTHSQEAYADSRPGKEADTVVGVGSVLTKILEDKYGYNVIHDKTTYDIVGGKEDRDVAYTMAEKGLNKILEENPTIEVVIDLHRDDGPNRVTMVNGEETALVMLFNGLSRDQEGPITHLENPYLQDNLAFSLQMQLKSRDIYPGLFIRNYLRSYRYNMHVRPKCLLVELGTDENTVESAKNAMKPFAEVLDAVLQDK